VLVGAESVGEIALEVIGEPKVVPDIRVRGAARLAVPVRRAVRLDFVRDVRDERRGLLEIGNGAVELADGDVAVAPMPMELVRCRVQRDALREGINRVAVTPQVGLTPAQPDDCLFALRVLCVLGFSLREVGLEPLARIGGDLHRVERLAEQ
jgi:hypothetical protein